MSALDFEIERADKLAEIGSQLRQARKAKSISIEQIAATTLIQPRTLRAIEAGKLEHLPEPVYVQGFIRRFADALGLNGLELASTFPTQRAVLSTRSDWKELPATQLRPFHLYLLYIFLVVAAVSGLSYFINRSVMKRESAPASNVPSQVSTKTNQPNTLSRAPVSSSPTARLAPPNPSVASRPPIVTAPKPGEKPVRVGVTLKAESWIEVKVDGKTEFAGILPSGTQRSWAAEEKLVVRSGNAGGVLASFNNAPAKPLGEPGTVETATFEAKPAGSTSPQPPITPAVQ